MENSFEKLPFPKILPPFPFYPRTNFDEKFRLAILKPGTRQITIESGNGKEYRYYISPRTLHFDFSRSSCARARVFVKESRNLIDLCLIKDFDPQEEEERLDKFGKRREGRMSENYIYIYKQTALRHLYCDVSKINYDEQINPAI